MLIFVMLFMSSLILFCNFRSEYTRCVNSTTRKFFFAICNLQFCSSVVVTREVVSGPAFNRKRE